MNTGTGDMIKDTTSNSHELNLIPEIYMAVVKTQPTHATYL